MEIGTLCNELWETPSGARRTRIKKRSMWMKQGLSRNQKYKWKTLVRLAGLKSPKKHPLQKIRQLTQRTVTKEGKRSIVELHSKWQCVFGWNYQIWHEYKTKQYKQHIDLQYSGGLYLICANSWGSKSSQIPHSHRSRLEYRAIDCQTENINTTIDVCEPYW